MKKLLVVPVLIGIMLLTACGGATSSSTTPSDTTATSLGKLTLDDSHAILDIMASLPDTFEIIDPASEGISNEDMGLGSYFSEVEAFLSEEPFQMIYGFMYIEDSKAARASTDAIIRDEAQINQMIIENVTAGLEEESVTDSTVATSITYPAIGDLAVYGEGQITTGGMEVGFDMLWFRVNNTYICLYSVYYGADYATLNDAGKEITNRVEKYE